MQKYELPLKWVCPDCKGEHWVWCTVNDPDFVSISNHQKSHLQELGSVLQRISNKIKTNKKI